jgi:alpha-N-arabinofuranosidase
MRHLPIACLLLALAISPRNGASAERIRVPLDIGETGAPISPFIYGQFIEHLGRSIYGGIWAQMLEDRKFYFPITEAYAPYKSLEDTEFPVVGASPWQIIGDPAAIEMVRDDSFVGDQTPLVRQGAGIRQLDLGVRKDLAYDGYIWARPTGSKPGVIEVSLVWGDGDFDHDTTRLTFEPGAYTRQSFSFTADATLDRGAALEIRSVEGDLLVGTVSLMPGDNVRGMRADTLALLKQLKGTMYRWPGGNFVSGYDWRDGIGDRDRRPPRKNPAWTGVEHNDFGTDEFLDFCRELAAEPMIAVNTGFGDAYSAAQWVEYTNAAADTLGGSWRAANGRPEPHEVRYWSVGNEMFGSWQLGFMQLHHYVLKHNAVADAMWAIDPDLVLIGVGDLEGINQSHDPQQVERGITWSHGMLESSADHMDLISEHIYVGRTPWSEHGRVPLTESVIAAKSAIRRKAEGHRELQASLPNLDGRLVPIAMDEWNYWHRDYQFGELGCSYDLADGLGIAEGLHEFFRQSDIIHMAHYAQTVNVIGAIKTTRIAAEMESTGLVLQMYREHFGQIPLWLADTFAPYDVAAALSADGETLTLGIVNPTPSEVEVTLHFTSALPQGRATRWHVTGADEFAANFPGRPRAVDIERTAGLPANRPLPVPPLSATVFSIPLE